MVFSGEVELVFGGQHKFVRALGFDPWIRNWDFSFGFRGETVGASSFSFKSQPPLYAFKVVFYGELLADEKRWSRGFSFGEGRFWCVIMKFVGACMGGILACETSMGCSGDCYEFGECEQSVTKGLGMGSSFFQGSFSLSKRGFHF